MIGIDTVSCDSESDMSNLIQNDLDSENGNFNPIVYLLSSLKEENPEIVAQLEALFHSSSSSSSSSRKKRELENDSDDDESMASSTKRPRLSVDDDMQIDIEEAEGNTFLERMRNMKKKNYKQRLFFDFECHKFINENDFTNIFCARMESKINYDKVTDEWFAKFEKAKDFKNEKGQWVQNKWFNHQVEYYRTKQFTVFHNENCKKEFELFCDEKGIKLEKEVKELTPEEEWFVKFEDAKDFKNEKGQWIQNTWFRRQGSHYRSEQYTVFHNENCQKEFKLFCDEKGINLEKELITPRQKWKNNLYDVCNWMYTHKKRPTKKHNKGASYWIVDQNQNYNKNKYIMNSDNIVRDIWKHIQNYMDNKEWELMKDYVLKLQKEDDDDNDDNDEQDEEENMNEDNDDQDEEENMNEDDADQDMNMNNNHVEYDANELVESSRKRKREDNDDNKAFEHDNREYGSNELIGINEKEYFTQNRKNL